MSSFFTKKDVEFKSRPDGKTLSCVSCGLYKDCKTPKMKPYGEFKKRVLVLGEAPGELEDTRGKPFQGKTGQLLQRTLKKLGVDLFEDCLCYNTVNCRPVDEKGDNRTPTNYEIECCRKSVLKVIEEYKPRVIIMLGASAVYSLIGHRWKKDLGGISKWRGFTIPDKDFNAWLCPTYHPSYVERAEKGVEETVWIQDLKAAIRMINEDIPTYKDPRIDIINDLTILEKIKEGTIAFDYETTGLKPHAKGHRVVCCAIATSVDHAYVFMMPDTREARQPFINLLANPNVGKMAHNMKYEETWSAVRLRQPVQNWTWDSMLAAHILDNRPGVTSLKFQAYVQFGIVDYSSDIAPFLKAVDDSDANAINKIQMLIAKPGGKEKLMKYCALDAIYEYRLAMKQQSEIQLPF
jgi:uracil-DNA glycosylase